jgi:chromosome segregation ATPase
MSCFDKLQAEKLNLSNKLSGLEQDLRTLVDERNSFKTSLGLTTDTLDALRQSKRMVETKLQTAVELGERQRLELDNVRAEQINLSELLIMRTANLEALQQELVSSAFCGIGLFLTTYGNQFHIFLATECSTMTRY